jgi:hypothetical protein
MKKVSKKFVQIILLKKVKNHFICFIDSNINQQRFKYLDSTKKRMQTDGLNSIRYEVFNITEDKLFTKLLINYNQTEIAAN